MNEAIRRITIVAIALAALGLTTLAAESPVPIVTVTMYTDYV